MATVAAKERAAQAWCTETTSGTEMDTDLAEAFANILDAERERHTERALDIIRSHRNSYNGAQIDSLLADLRQAM